ncbi:MAG: T9SS C-terminal target domain-containing protein [Bacteroidetes bacterium]|nr:T9SS C-terminal target domain-containing protein [Bacteroidota bacterium]
MKRINKLILAATAFYFVTNTVQSKENVGQIPKQTSVTQQNSMKLATVCSQSGSRIDLDLNNVRTKILGGGDMWWDLKDVKYEIPKDSKKHSLFAGSLWIGGYTNGNLKVAAMTYRQSGNDFWPGPLDGTASVDATVCAQYDKHFVITRKEVQEFVSNWSPGVGVPASIEGWPAFDRFNNAGITQPLAPFYDKDQNGEYNPSDGGDYPGYSLNNEMGNCKTEAQLFGDRTLWWVFNDKGNVHSESETPQIGLEIHAQAFAFQTNDEINNMTFYQYQVFNRSTDNLQECYLGMWVDPDLGNPNDDFIGCDVARGLGYCYNGDADDDGNGENSYGLNPPAIGVDYFQGPLADFDQLDNPADSTFNGTGYGDGIVDNERLGMEKFMFYRNDFSLEGNPSQQIHYYNYLQGKWKDNNPITYGGTGHLSSTILCDFMYPGDTDPNNSTPWFQTGTAYDGRFMHSSGPFTLQPGAVNLVTVGAVWARTSSGGPMESVNLMKAADDKAQRLFDNCFKVLDGPDAPDLSFRELDREIIVYIKNKPNSNNAQDKYLEVDPTITSPPGLIPPYDPYYRFQGYQIFQMRYPESSIADIYFPDLARLVAQCDIKDGVTQLTNFKFDASINANVPQIEVVGADNGITKSFRLTQDMFATGDKRMVNHKSYYYFALAYAYNNYKTYDQGNPNSFDGQKAPYKAGRNNVGVGGKPYTVIPHIIAPENSGTYANSEYGMQPEVTRIEGQGNGGNYLELTEASENAIIGNPNFKTVTYQAGAGPINVKVIDPLRIQPTSFTLKLTPVAYTPEGIDKATWVLINDKTGEKAYSDNGINIGSEVITDWGISVSLQQAVNPGDDNAINNGLISSSITFSNNTKRWLSGVPDADFPFPVNWIRAGTVSNTPQDIVNDDYAGLDEGSVYESLIPANIGYGSGGTWAPYQLCATTQLASVPGSTVSGGFAGVAWKGSLVMGNVTNFEKIASVDVVITSDQSKWTRCVVFETNDDTTKFPSQAPTRKFDLRDAQSVGKDGLPDASGTRGMSWFPGYAINIETGERLNMAFGEDSHFDGVNSLTNENGADMIWNPTANADLQGAFSTVPNPAFGGRHYVYIFNHNTTQFETGTSEDQTNVPAYDSCKFVYGKMSSTNFHPNEPSKRAVFKDIMWAGIPLLAPNQQFMSSDVRIKLRVTKPFENNYAANGYRIDKTINTDGPRANPAQNNNYPMYSFNTFTFAPKTYDKTTAENALNLINVVPNPYYGFSNYEQNRVDNEIKITNLPQKCTIKIYTLNGTLIREFSKDETLTSLNWDLKNQVGIPIASGAYIIHVDVPNVGEKIIKWFGALRPLDLDNY